MQIKALCAALNDAGLTASVWRMGRIYINGLGKDMKVFIDLDEPLSMDYNGVYDGCKLRAYSDASQTVVWLNNRAKQVKHHVMKKMHEAGIVGEVCAEWQDVML